jgi:hypothetical protein
MADENGAPEGADDDVVVSVEDNDAPQLTEIEELASDMGWTPQDAWKGDPDAWKPAKDYVRATRDVNRSLKDSLKRVERQIEGITRTTAAMTDRAVEEARTKWEAELERAVDDGDKAAAKEASAQLRRIEANVSAPEGSPEGEDFAAKHSSWFGKDKEATAYAVNRAEHYASQGLSPARQLAAVEREMKNTFPELFEEEKPQRRQPAVGEPQRTTRTTPREKGYATLPPEARKACDAWVEGNKHRGAFVTKEAWSKQFYETQEAANG